MKKRPILLFILLSSLLHGEIILIDFGDSGETTNTGAPNKYNNITNNMNVNLNVDLVDTDNQATGITLTSTNWFAGANSNGTTNGSAPYASTATGDSLYDANNTWGPAPGDAMVVLVLGGLSSLKTYDFTMFASRISAGENRSTDYSFVGGNSDSTVLNPSDNVTSTSSVFGITPDGSGEVTLTITPGAANANTYDFIYLGTLEINAIPEPTTLTLMLSALGVLFLFRRRR